MSYVLMKGKERGDLWVTGSPHSSASLQADFCISRAPWRFLSSTSIHHAPHIIVSTQIQPCISARAGERRRGLHVSATGRKTDVSYMPSRAGKARRGCTEAICSGWVKRKIRSAAWIAFRPVSLSSPCFF